MSKWQFAITRWAVFGLLNWEIDREADRWAQMFLPWYLARETSALSNPGLPGSPPLVAASELVLGQERPEPELPGPLFGLIFLGALLLLMLLPLAAARRSPRAGFTAAGATALAVGLPAAFYGSLLLFSRPASPYPETWATQALLYFHPLHWFLVVSGMGLLRNRPWAPDTARRYYLAGAIISVLLLLLEQVDLLAQRIWHYGLACLVVSAAGAIVLRRLTRARS